MDKINLKIIAETEEQAKDIAKVIDAYNSIDWDNIEEGTSLGTILDSVWGGEAASSDDGVLKRKDSDQAQRRNTKK